MTVWGPCSLHISVSIAEQAVANSAFIASMACSSRCVLSSQTTTSSHDISCSECSAPNRPAKECSEEPCKQSWQERMQSPSIPKASVHEVSSGQTLCRKLRVPQGISDRMDAGNEHPRRWTFFVHQLRDTVLGSAGHALHRNSTLPVCDDTLLQD